MFQEWLKDYKKLREENNMSEEEILEIMKNLLLMPTDWIIKSNYKGNLEHIGALQGNEAIEGLLDLYEKEKEKNNKALEYIETLEINSIGTTFKYTEIGNEIWKRLKGE